MKRKNQDNLWKGGAKGKLSISDVLFSIFDGVADAFISVGSYKPYRVSAKEYAQLNNGHSDIRRQLYYLKKQRLIKRLVKNNEHYFELTKKGYKQLIWKDIARIEKPVKWNKSFRVVMFDIPESKKDIRNVIRAKLIEIGFIQFQKSVFIYPFECKKQIDILNSWCGAGKYVKYMVIKITEGEEEIIEEFLQRDILSLDDLE